ncbi:MAG TPA: hypothetical protein P5253_07540 [bacterium]|nr:hypothetical protein [bacterium]
MRRTLCSLSYCSTIALVIVLVLTGVCDGYSRSSSELDNKLFDSLLRYEKYVRTNEDPRYGYKLSQGYPMYLYTFGMMHYRLYLLTEDEYYKNKVINIADTAESIRNADWTWYFYDGSKFTQDPVSLYNCQFTELFLYTYRLTDDKKYMDFARKTIYALPELLYFIGSTAAYNYFFYPFTMIAEYLYSTGENSAELKEAGEYAYYMAMQGYNPNTKKWYYSPAEYIRGFYDGHSANYQLGEMASFLEHQDAIRAIFPEEYNYFLNELPGMLDVVKRYQLPSGAYYYNNDAPDCTETIGGVISFYTLYDRTFKTNHDDIIKRCIETILGRQAPNGAYYKTAGSDVAEIWYGDGIGLAIPLYLLMKENGKKEDKVSEKPEAIKERKSREIILGDYDAELRDTSGRVDSVTLIKRLKSLGVNTYAYLIWHSPDDWEDLCQSFMPLAQEEDINVIVYMVPPSEPPSPKPYEYDYIEWAQAIGKLSRRYPGLIGIAIDDFNYNTSFFTPSYLKEIKKTINNINPSLRLFTVSYYRDITDTFLAQYGEIIDGVIFPFRNEPRVDTVTTSTLDPQVRSVRATLGDKLSVIIMIYASKLSSATIPPDARYLRETISTSLELIEEGIADGIITYCLPKVSEEDEMFKTVKELFSSFNKR